MDETFTVLQAHDYYGGGAGMKVYYSAAVTGMATGYVKASSDTTIFDGTLAVKYAFLPPS